MGFKGFPLVFFLPEHSPSFYSEQKRLSHASQQFFHYKQLFCFLRYLSNYR